MAALTIRDLDDELKARLRLRAARHGRSMEAEVRAILQETLARSEPLAGLGTRIHQRFADIGGAELELPDRHDVGRAVDLPE
jgi:plasmid stability protein